MAGPYRFAAFISYSSRDSAFAHRLHRALENYRIPTALGSFDLAGKPNRVFPVFRDREELPAGRLGPELEAALDDSGALVVVCSPNAAASAWVDKEIRYFEQAHGPERIFAIIIDGKPNASARGDTANECFPPALRADRADGPALDPIAADARASADGFRSAWLKVVAGILDVRLGMLLDRDRAVRARRRLALVSAAAVATLAGVAVAAAVDASAARAYFLARSRVLIQAGRPDDAARFAVAAEPAADDLAALLPAREADETLQATGISLRRLLRLGGPGDIESITYAGVPDRWLVGAGDREVLWDSHRGAAVGFAGMDALGVGSKLSPSAARLVIQNGVGGRAVLWNVANLRPVGSLAAGGDLYVAEFSPRGDRLLTIDGDDAASLWDANDGRRIAGLGDVQGTMKHAYFSSDDRRLLTTARDGRANLWDAGDGRQVGAVDSLPTNWDTPFSPTGRFFISQSVDNAAALWDAVVGRKLLDLGGRGSVRSATFSPDNRRLVTESDTGEVTLWDPLALRKIAVLAGDPMVAEYFSPDGGQVVARAERGRGAVFDATTGARIGFLSAAERLVELSPTGSRILEVLGDRMRLWDTRTGKLAFEIASDPAPEGKAESDPGFSLDGAWLAVPQGSGDIAVWSVGRGVTQATLPAAGDVVRFSADGRELISFSKEGAGVVWDVRSGRRLAYLGGPGALKSVEPSGDLRSIGAVATDGYAALWDLGEISNKNLSGVALRQRACAINREAIGAFSARDLAADSRVQMWLAGRPVHPCDWRGPMSLQGLEQAFRHWSARLAAN